MLAGSFSPQMLQVLDFSAIVILFQSGTPQVHVTLQVGSGQAE